MRERHSLRVDVKPDGGVVLHVAPENIAALRRALDDAEAGHTVTLGDGPTFVIKPVRK